MITETLPIVSTWKISMTYALLSMGTCSLLLGVRVFLLNRTLAVNRRVMIFAISSYLWCVGYAIMFNCTNVLSASIFRFIGLLGALLWASQGPMLIIERYNNSQQDKFHIEIYDKLLIIISVSIAIGLCLPKSVEFTTMPYGVTLYSNITVFRVIFFIYLVIIILGSMLHAILWYRTTEVIRERRFFLLCIYVLITYPIGGLLDVVFPALHYPAFPGSCFTCFISMIMIYIASNRYNAISVSIKNIASYIFESVGTPAVVLDRKGSIILENPAAEKFLHLQREEYKDIKINIDDLFTSEESIVDKIPELIATSQAVYTMNSKCNVGGELCQLDISVVLDRYNECLCMIILIRDTTNEYKILEQLEKSREDAICASKAKSIFLANMSHEIRTPINAILGINELILRECAEEKIISYAEDVKNASHTLLSLINDILDVSKIESGKFEIIEKEYMISSTLHDIVNIIMVKVNESKLQLKLDIGEDIPSCLYGDEVRVKQIILNLLSNAVKYTKEGIVTLSVHKFFSEKNKIDLVIEVKDTGIGIKDEDMKSLFDIFQRVDELNHRHVEGAGLGLNIVNSLTTLMNGKLFVQSEYGKGSIFTVHLPQKVVQSDPIGDFKLSSSVHEVKAEPIKSYTAPEAKILVVDDNFVNLHVFKGLLKKLQIKVDTAESGEKCIQMVQQKVYDIIFLDHMMPVMDGIETLHQLQKMTDNLSYNKPVIALTANAIGGAKEKYLEKGFKDYLSKPVNYIKLEKMIERYLPKELVMKET